jgi:hypothetical protein
MRRRQKERLSRPPWDRMMQIHERIKSGKFPNCVGMSNEMGVYLRTLKRDVEFMKERLKMSKACRAISQRGGQFGAISGVRACLTVLLLLLVTQIASAGAAESAPPGTSIPAIAGIAKIKIGSPAFELRKGERDFRIDGVPAFVLGRNPVGVNPEAFDEHFQNAAAAGGQLMRIHFTYSPAGEKAGEIHPGMLQAWGAVLAETFRIARTGQSRYPEAVMHTWPCIRVREPRCFRAR